MRQNFKIILFLFTISIAGFSFISYIKSSHNLSKKSPFSPTKSAVIASKKCASQVNWPLCYSKELEEIVYRHGPENGYKALSEIQKIELRLKSGCHSVAHGIGWGVYKRDPAKALTAMASSNPICGYGEQMGILERYMAKIPGGRLSKEQIQNICAADPGTECNHGMGHMFLIETRNNTEEALKFCNYLVDVKQRTICLSGIFMEKIIGANLHEHGISDGYLSWKSRFSEHDALCRSYTDPYIATACWRIAPIMAQYRIQNHQDMFDFCNTAQTREAAWSCKMHYITIVTSRDIDLEKLQPICRLDSGNEPTFESECYKYMPIIKINSATLEEVKNPVSFCIGLPNPANQSACFWGIGHALYETRTVKDKRESFCNKASKKYKSLCLGESKSQQSNTVLHDMKLPGGLY